MDLVHLAPRRLIAQLVAKNIRAPGDEGLEKSLCGEPFHREGRRPGTVEIDDRTSRRAAHEGPHHHAGHARGLHRMHAEPAVRVGLAVAEKGAQFVFRNQHGGSAFTLFTRRCGST